MLICHSLVLDNMYLLDFKLIFTYFMKQVRKKSILTYYIKLLDLRKLLKYYNTTA